MLPYVPSPDDSVMIRTARRVIHIDKRTMLKRWHRGTIKYHKVAGVWMMRRGDLPRPLTPKEEQDVVPAGWLSLSDPALHAQLQCSQANLAYCMAIWNVVGHPVGNRTFLSPAQIQKLRAIIDDDREIKRLREKLAAAINRRNLSREAAQAGTATAELETGEAESPNQEQPAEQDAAAVPPATKESEV